jgi:L-iditol 2-dehydrogenase
MKAAVWHGPREMRIEEVPYPKIAPDEVLLRVVAAGICGSELSGYLGLNSLRRPPLIMGHEFAGTVVEVGAQATGRAIGERLTVNPMVPDNTCVMCRRGAEHLCLNRSLIGAHRPGAFAEYVAVPAKACYPLPDSMDDITGTLIEPLACAVRAVEHAGVTLGSSVAILGAGPIGLLALVSARLAGATVVAIADVNPARLEVARAWGATHTVDSRAQDLATVMREATGGLGGDSAIDAVGLPVTRNQAVAAVRASGRVIFLGLHEDEVTLPGNTIVRSEITVQGSFCYTQANFLAAMRMLQHGLIPSAESWLTLRPLEEAGPSFDQLIDAPADTTKVVLRI